MTTVNTNYRALDEDTVLNFLSFSPLGQTAISGNSSPSSVTLGVYIVCMYVYLGLLKAFYQLVLPVYRSGRQVIDHPKQQVRGVCTQTLFHTKTTPTEINHTFT